MGEKWNPKEEREAGEREGEKEKEEEEAGQANRQPWMSFLRHYL